MSYFMRDHIEWNGTGSSLGFSRRSDDCLLGSFDFYGRLLNQKKNTVAKEKYNREKRKSEREGFEPSVPLRGTRP